MCRVVHVQTMPWCLRIDVRDTEVVSEKISANLILESFPPTFLHHLSVHNHYGSSSHVGFSDAERHKAICSSFWKAAKDIKPTVNLIPNYTLENLAHLILIF